mmetsp:Transcript_26568/g.61445  ORF Transcript_26568/g.61445 Transcript_26568/m.61445 type:complete len:203 (+) Transcript_26568:1631-2239(+)
MLMHIRGRDRVWRDIVLVRRRHFRQLHRRGDSHGPGWAGRGLQGDVQRVRWLCLIDPRDKPWRRLQQDGPDRLNFGRRFRVCVLRKRLVRDDHRARALRHPRRPRDDPRRARGERARFVRAVAHLRQSLHPLPRAAVPLPDRSGVKRGRLALPLPRTQALLGVPAGHPRHRRDRDGDHPHRGTRHRREHHDLHRTNQPGRLP